MSFTAHAELRGLGNGQELDARHQLAAPFTGSGDSQVESIKESSRQEST